MAPWVPEHIRRLVPYSPGKPIEEVQREIGVADCIKLASNENPLGPSPRAMAAIAEALPRLHYYPDGGGFYLKRALSERYGVDPASIILGNGSNELIELLVRTFMVPGTHAISSASSFVIYKLVTLAAGHPFREAPLTPERGYDLDAIAARVDAQTRIIFLANPNNPTGTYFDVDALSRFAEQVDVRAGAEPPLIVLDEAYREFVDAPGYPDGLDLVRRRPRTMAMRTFSKAYGLAALRVGFGLTQPELVQDLNRVRAPFNVNGMGLVGAEAAVGDVDFITRSVAANATEKAFLVPELEARGLRVTPSQTNFVLVDFGRDAGEVFQALMSQGVIVRPMAGYALPTCQRITIGTRGQNLRLLAAIDAVAT